MQAMGARLVKLLKRAAWCCVGIAFVALLGLRAYDSQRGPPLQLWHTYVPHELSAPNRSARRTGAPT